MLLEEHCRNNKKHTFPCWHSHRCVIRVWLTLASDERPTGPLTCSCRFRWTSPGEQALHPGRRAAVSGPSFTRLAPNSPVVSRLSARSVVTVGPLLLSPVCVCVFVSEEVTGGVGCRAGCIFADHTCTERLVSYG